MPSSLSNTLPPTAEQWVVCLCADWCGLCRDYRQVFEQLAARYPHSRFAWVDIEDHSDLLGDMDVETFPTVLLADANGTQFAGALTPHPETLSRLLDSWARSALATTPYSASTGTLLQGLRDRPDLWV